MQLTEKYRPTTWEQVVGQDAVIAKIRGLAGRGLAGRAYWLSGPSGSGKTTIARLLAGDVASDWDVEEVDGTTLTINAVRELDHTLTLRGMGGRGRVVIVNESHGLRADVQRYFLVALERIPGHAMWVFTTTNAGQKALFDGIDAAPLLSRCVKLPLHADTGEAFARRAREIAAAEGLDGQPHADYLQLARDCSGNLRAMIQAIEVGEVPRAAAPKVPDEVPGETILERNQRRLAAALAGRG